MDATGIGRKPGVLQVMLVHDPLIRLLHGTMHEVAATGTPADCRPQLSEAARCLIEAGCRCRCCPCLR